MQRHRPFRFGVAAYDAASREAWLSLARRAEMLGYSTLAINDHLGTQPAPIAAIAAAAQVTTTLRLGCGVFANDFRHPVIFAKEAASLDVLSDGRFELGLGAGWRRADYEPAGLAFDPPGVRVARLSEAVRILKAAFGDAPVDFAGAHYTVKRFELRPKPVQRPHPPLLIGGAGKRVLTLAAQEADIVSLTVKGTAEGGLAWESISPAATAQKVAWVHEAVSDRANQPELHLMAIFVAVSDAPADVATAMLRQWDITDELGSDELLVSPHTLIGSEDEIVEMLLALRQRFGISYVSVFQEAMEAFAPIVARLSGQ
jgi:probable F420-dependent oxidoreductase